MSFFDRLEKLKKGKEEERKKAEILERIKKEKEDDWEKDLARIEKEKEQELEFLAAEFRKKKEEEYREKADYFRKQFKEEIANLEKSYRELLANKKQNEKELEELSRRIQAEKDSSILNLTRQRLLMLKKELEIAGQELKRISDLKENKEKALQSLSEENLKIELKKEIDDYIQTLKEEKEAELEVLKEKARKAREVEAAILLKQQENLEKKEETAISAAPTISAGKGIKKLTALWEKVSGKKLVPESSGPPVLAPGLEGLAELKIDFFKGDSKIIIYATVPGSRLEDIDISLEEENDVLTIKGLAKRPEKEKGEEGKFIIQECQWGPFFRQINLTAEINVFGIKAKLENGILIIELPILKPGEEKRGIQKIKIEE